MDKSNLVQTGGGSETFEITDDDLDAGNLAIRAGYIFALAQRAGTPEDKVYLQRAARSLLAFSEILYGHRDMPKQWASVPLHNKPK